MTESMIGVYLYPASIIFSEPTNHIEASECREFTFAGERLIVSRSGYIGLITEDKEKSYIYLNTIMGSIALIHSPFYIIAARADLLSHQYDSSTRTAIVNHFPYSIRGDLQYGSTFREIFITTLIDENRWSIILNLAQKIISCDLVDYFFPFIRGYCFGFEREYLQAFISYWFTIELCLQYEYNMALSDSKFVKLSSKPLKSPGIFNIIENLYFMRLITEVDKKQAHKIREIRNKIIHKVKSPTHEEINECSSLSKRLLFRIFRKKGCNIKKYINGMNELKVMENFSAFINEDGFWRWR